MRSSGDILHGVVKSFHTSSSPVAPTTTGTPSSAQSTRTAFRIPSLALTAPPSPTASVRCLPRTQGSHQAPTQVLDEPSHQAHTKVLDEPSRRPRTRNPLLERFLSAEALELLDEAEAKRSSLPRLLEHRARLNALAKLPTAFDMVRYIFGVGRGPSLMDEEEVVEKIKSKSTERGGISLEEARLQVNLPTTLASLPYPYPKP